MLFERIKAQRSVSSTTLPAPEPSPIRQPELMTLAPQIYATPGPVQQKDMIQRLEDVVKFRETEYNLLLNSKDRDWLHGTEENRYRFSVVLNGGTRPQGLGIQAMIQNRFRNIVRIEFVKAMLPVEALEVVVPRDCSGNSLVEDAFSSVLSLPFVTVTMDELQGNNYGTNEGIDKSLAVIQYDAAWRSDAHVLTRNSNRGYTLFFPKHMKAQRIYAPTPLSNLQKLSFQLLDPENMQLSKIPDAVKISRIVLGSDISGGTCYDTSGYLFIQTKESFPVWAFSQMDHLKIDGLTTVTVNPAYTSAMTALNRWLQREQGHTVLSVGHATGSSLAVSGGGNACGYANWIIVRNRHVDPASGSCALDPFMGSFTNEAAFWTAVRAFPAESQDGGALNLSRQVQLVLRIITRDMDSATNMRPDNI